MPFTEYFRNIPPYMLLMLSGTFTAIVYKVRAIFPYLYNLIVQKTSYSVTISSENTVLFDAVQRFLEANYSTHINNVKARATTKEGVVTIVYDQYKDSALIKWKGARIAIAKIARESKKEGFSGREELEFFTLKGFSKSKILDLMDAIVHFYNELLKTNKELFIFVESDHYWNAINKIERGKNLILDSNITLQEDAIRFLEKKEWYKARGLRHKKSFLLHGPPGNGKTTAVQVLAAGLGKNIHYGSKSMFSKEQKASRLLSLVGESILLFEDLDCYMPSRDESSKEDRVDLSIVLNALDGTLTPDSIIIVATTNHLDKLDPALLRRFDTIIEFKNATPELTAQYINKFFETDSVSPSEITNSIPFFKLQELCLKSSTPLEAINKIENVIQDKGDEIVGNPSESPNIPVEI